NLNPVHGRRAVDSRAAQGGDRLTPTGAPLVSIPDSGKRDQGLHRIRSQAHVRLHYYRAPGITQPCVWLELKNFGGAIRVARGLAVSAAAAEVSRCASSPGPAAFWG